MNKGQFVLPGVSLEVYLNVHHFLCVNLCGMYRNKQIFACIVD